VPERRPNVVRRTETRFTGSRKPLATQPLDPTADREASDGRDCGGRGNGRRTPQGGKIPGEPGWRTGGEIQRRCPNRQREETPEARPRRTSSRRQARVTDDPGSATANRKGRRIRSTEPGRASSDAHDRHGYPGRRIRREQPEGSKRQAGCQSQEGTPRRETWAIAVRSSSEGKKPRERAGLKYTREVIAGARRWSRQERQGRNMTRAGKARGWWLAVDGLRWGGKKPRESRSSGFVPAARNPGKTLKTGLKSEEGSSPGQTGGASRRENHGVDEPRGGSAEPMKR